MAQTLLQLQKQIAALNAKAEKVRQTEVKGVIAKIRSAIDAYGLTAEDLFGASARRSVGVRRPKLTEAKYSDGKGNTWVGRGKRPEWLRSALAAGANLADFAQGSPGAPSAVTEGTAPPKGPGAPKKARGRKPSAKRASKVKYQDGTGNSWSGRGRRPKWIVDALAAGKSVDDFAAV